MYYDTLYSVHCFQVRCDAKAPLYYQCDAFRRTSRMVAVGEVVWC